MIIDQINILSIILSINSCILIKLVWFIDWGVPGHMSLCRALWQEIRPVSAFSQVVRSLNPQVAENVAWVLPVDVWKPFLKASCLPMGSHRSTKIQFDLQEHSQVVNCSLATATQSQETEQTVKLDLCPLFLGLVSNVSPVPVNVMTSG